MEDGLPVYNFGRFRLHTGKRLLLDSAGAQVPITPKAYDTLTYLVRRAGHVVGKDELMRAVWPDIAVEENNLTQNISSLRRVLGEERGERRFIATVPGRGYQFVASVTADPADSAHPRSETNSIAVLPFVNVSADPEYDYFVDGLADELINALSKISDLRVAARTSAFSFKGRRADVREIATHLGVSLVLEGSVRNAGSRVRISAHLVNAADGYQLWAQRYDREAEIGDFFQVQDEIAAAVMEALKPKLKRRDAAVVLKHATESIEAHEAYLKGRFHLFHLSPSGIEMGMKCFENAISLDRNHAPAYVGLAHAYRMFGLSLDQPAAEVGPKAKAAARNAVEMDGTLAEAHAVLAFAFYWYEWNIAAADRHFQLALQLNPNSADTLWMYAHLLSNMGDHTEALRLAARARCLDPLSGLIHAMEGQFLLHAGQTAKAASRLEEARELDPKSRVARLFAASAYIELGRYDDAIEQARTCYELAPSSAQALAYEGYAQAKAGRRAEACVLLERLLERARSRYVPPQDIALVHNALAHPREALEWLERAVEQHDPKLMFLKVDPKWRNFANDSRFQAILRQLNLLTAVPPGSTRHFRGG